MHHSLVKNILFGLWAMDPGAAQAHFPFIHSLLSERNPIPFQRGENSIQAMIMDTEGHAVRMNMDDDFQSPAGSSQEKFVSVLPMKDVIIKYDEACGPYGTETLARWFSQADNDPSVVAHILDADSPGGAGNAVEKISYLIKNSKKPVITYAGNGMMASAAYWIGSNAKEIYISFKSDEAGSIGSYVTIADVYKYYESQGLKVWDIYATKSTEKNKIWRDVLEGKEGAEERLKAEYIDPHNELFIQAIKSNRPGVKEAAFTGKLFTGDEILENGLADGYKSFEETVVRAFELGEEMQGSNSSTNSNNRKMSLIGKKYKAIEALASKKPEERTAEDIAAANAELQEAGINAVLVSVSDEYSNEEELTAFIQGKSDKVTELEGEITGLKDQVSDLQSKLKITPKAEAKGEAASAVAENADKLDEDEKEDFLNSETDQEVRKMRESMKTS